MWHGRTEVRFRPGQVTIWAHPCSNLRSFGSKCTVLKKKPATLLGLFGAPSAQLWNSQSPECRTTSPNSEITTTFVRPCIQNAHERLVRQVLLAKSTGKQPRGRPKTRWSVCTSDLAWSRRGVEPTELSGIAVDREVFWVLLGLVPLRPSLDEKRAWKWMKRITFTLFSLFTGV